jgi:hypothetical protein
MSYFSQLAIEIEDLMDDLSKTTAQRKLITEIANEVYANSKTFEKFVLLAMQRAETMWHEADLKGQEVPEIETLIDQLENVYIAIQGGYYEHR